MDKIRTIADIKRLQRNKGYHFFDKETMAYWGSRVESVLYPNMCFVTSEKDYSGEHRYYNVRQFDPKTCHINTVGEFNQYTNREQAITVAKSVGTEDFIKIVMQDCLAMRGYDVPEEKLKEIFTVYEDCQEWDDGKMLSGWTYEEIEDFVKHSSCVGEVFG